MNIENMFVAKTEINANKISGWLPLWMHSRDTAGIMVKLVNYWLSDAIVTRSGLSRELLEKIACFLGYTHDFGKMTSLFQSRITEKLPEYRSELNYHGYRVLNKNEYLNYDRTPHAYMSEWILTSRDDSLKVNKSMAAIIGAHHGKPMDKDDAEEKNVFEKYTQNFFGDVVCKNNWIELWNKELAQGLKCAGFASAKEIPEISAQSQMILSGLLIMADWIASNTEYFPLISTGTTGEENLYPKRVEDGWKKIALTPKRENTSCISIENYFEERFGFLPNDVQKWTVDIINGIGRPGIVILEAQMGIGKTETALAAAEIFAEKGKESGLFFGLPTQATTNGIFPRILDWAEKVSSDELSSIKVAHGAADLNELYETLSLKGCATVNEFETWSGVEVHPWFAGNKKALLSDFVLGTVDQFLMCSLKRKHVMLRHLGVAGKIVIIDECHAYDAYMNQYLDRALVWMASYGVPVILLSATLPSERRRKLIETYCKAYQKYYLHKKNRISDVPLDVSGYPLLSWSDGEEIKQSVFQGQVRSVEVRIHRLSSEMIEEDLIKKLKNGGCAVFIYNTVKNAQAFYQDLKCNSMFIGYKIILYHAHFTSADRVEKENMILRAIGKSSNNVDRNKVIVIGTQVLEQSLDYDADVMYSELCPMDLLLQRIGRLHRHSGRKRPQELSSPELTIIQGVNEVYGAGTKAVYGDLLLMRTDAVLPERICVPQDIPKLVTAVYDFDNDLKVKEEGYENAKLEYWKIQKEKKQKAESFLLGRPEQSGIIGLLQNEGDIDERQAEASVRDGSFSFEVIPVIMEGNHFRFISSEHVHEIIPDEIDVHMAKRLLREKIRLPGVFSAPWNSMRTLETLKSMKNRVPAQWIGSPWLNDTDFLIFDILEGAQLCDYYISYNKEFGLTYRGKENP